MQPAFKIAEQDRDRLDAFFVGQVFEPFLLDLVDSNALTALLLGVQVHIFQFVVRQGQEITQFV